MSIARILTFLAVVLAVLGSIHGYLWLRLIRDPAWAPPTGRILTLALFALAATVPAFFLLTRPLSRAAIQPLAWVAFIWMGVMFLLFSLLVPGDLGVLTFLGLRRLLGEGPLDPSRRLLLSRGLAGAVTAAAAGLSAVAIRQALREVEVVEVTLELPRLPAGWRGARIVQLTDVHVGPTIGQDFIEQLVERTNALEPDLVAITGDLVDGSVAELGPLCAPLQRLRARHGVYFVTGNHEYYSGVDAWIDELRRLGIQTLRNERVRLERGGESLELAGIDDWTATGPGHGPDLPRALEGRDPSIPVLLLAHQPKAAEEAARLGVDAQLSGHTHGGQIFPFGLLARLDTPYVQGLYQVSALKLYVSPGTGYWGPPMRLATRAEVTQITLA